MSRSHYPIYRSKDWKLGIGKAEMHTKRCYEHAVLHSISRSLPVRRRQQVRVRKVGVRVRMTAISPFDKALYQT